VSALGPAVRLRFAIHLLDIFAKPASAWGRYDGGHIPLDGLAKVVPAEEQFQPGPSHPGSGYSKPPCDEDGSWPTPVAGVTRHVQHRAPSPPYTCRD
jgi:hypothetical protein